jgi:hypothetical protein
MMADAIPFEAKKLARLVAMVLLPDPPLELITSVVFIRITASLGSERM